MHSNHLSERRILIALAALSIAALAAPAAHAQNVASQKAYFSHGETEILGTDGDTIMSGAIKTSGVGDMMISVSMECSLWTSTSTTSTKGGGKSSSTSRAAVNATVLVDGQPAAPGQVVFCDREQQVSLQFSSNTVEVTDAITLELFQKTKDAATFNFYALDLGAGVHRIEVRADSIVEPDPNAPNTASSGTRAAVGKRTLYVEEINNP